MLPSNKEQLPVYLISILVMTICGCQIYQPEPIAWQQEAGEWRHASQAHVKLALTEAVTVALTLNPGINELRLAHQSAQKQVLASGWWEDPAFDLDVLRILSSAASPWIVGSGLSFTLPLNGVPGLEKQAAAAYADANALAVRVAEQHLIAELEQEWLVLDALKQRSIALHRYKDQLVAGESRIRQLAEAGELPLSEADHIALERVKLELICPRCTTTMLLQEQKLIRLLGLHPETPLVFQEFTPVRDAASITSTVSLPSSRFGRAPESELELTSHLRIKEQLIRFQGSEVELKAEIRKQYPDLEIGPLFAHEEGRARLGGSLGFKLPLWNRNRQGIAHARTIRDSTRLETLHIWRELTTEWRELEKQLQAVEGLLELIRSEQVPGAEQAAIRIRQLYQEGEASLPALLAAEAVLYEAREALINAELEYNQTYSKLNLVRVQ